MQVLQLDWLATTRTAILIADAPCHGARFHHFDDHFPLEPDPHGLTAEALLTRFNQAGVDLVFARISAATDIMVQKFREVSHIRELPLEGNSTTELAERFRSLTAEAIGEKLMASSNPSVTLCCTTHS